MDKVWAELCQAESRLSAAQSVRTCGQLFQERRERQSPEWGIRFNDGCRHDGILFSAWLGMTTIESKQE
jgi:hypothetical protein